MGDNCPLCRTLDGLIFEAASRAAEQYSPPVHINCDCLWVEVLDDEVGAQRVYDPADENLQALTAEHGHFVTDGQKYQPLRVPASPSGRDFTFRRVRNPETGEIERRLEWHRPRYQLDGLDPTTVQTGVTKPGEKWTPVRLTDLKPQPDLRAVPGHPELLTETDRIRYSAHFADAPQPAGIPATSPGPAGHVGSVGEFTWNPADNDLDRPMPEAMRDFLGSRGFDDNAMEGIRRKLWRWSDREYLQPDVQETMHAYVRRAPKFQGRIERHLSLPVNADGRVDVAAFRGGKLEAEEHVTLDTATCFTAGARRPGNVVLVVDENRRGASIRGFVKPDSLVEDEVVVPAGTEYEVTHVQTFEWRRPGSDQPEQMVVVRMRETNVERR